jgi:hypothetical protein
MTHLEKLRKAANDAARRHGRALAEVETAAAEYRDAHNALVAHELELSRQTEERNRPKNESEKDADRVFCGRSDLDHSQSCVAFDGGRCNCGLYGREREHCPDGTKCRDYDCRKAHPG